MYVSTADDDSAHKINRDAQRCEWRPREEPMLTPDERLVLDQLVNGACPRKTLLTNGVQPTTIQDLEKLGLIAKAAARPTFSTNPDYAITDEGRWRLTVPAPRRLYIRLGRWCSCGASWNAHTNTLERGISVFECYEVAAKQWLAVLDHAWRKDAKDFRDNARSSGKKWYFVEGTQIGAGGDQEPLLVDVTFAAELSFAQGRFVEVNHNSTSRSGTDPNHQSCGGQPCP